LKRERSVLLENFKAGIWLEIVALAAISGFVYLVHAGSLSYFRDDWYYMYDGLVGGRGIFVEMFRHLRPARGPLFEWLYGMFGANPLPYHLLLYGWRLAGGLGALWLFRSLWPKARLAAFNMALLFLIYPGFLWWVQGFEYQPMVLSVGLQVFSIALTLKAVRTEARAKWIFWMLASVLTGWAYLAFVEYAIGMEFFRWLCVFLIVSQKIDKRTLKQKILATFRAAAVTLLIPLGFLVWRQFIFENQRKAADLGLQLSAVLGSPNNALWWLVHFFQSVFNVAVAAWVTPFTESFFSLRLRDLVVAGCWMVLAVAVFIVVSRWIADKPADSRTWPLEAVWIGLLGVGAGVVPIIAANRVVTFDRFSHYALPVSLAAVMFVVGLVNLLSDPKIRMAVIASLIGVSALTHAAVASQARAEQEIIRAFWHQVAWRAPDLRPGTTLVVNYPDINYGEGSDIVWGPANVIYYPQPQRGTLIAVPIAAARMEADTTGNILARTQDSQTYIVVNEIQYDFDNVLVMSMPFENACVHIMDSRWSEISAADPALIGLAAPTSRIENVILESQPHIPPVVVFGTEPLHEWCYYYQKAQLARQHADWAAIAEIGDEAARLDLRPNDQIEWMPFLQAGAVLGDEKQVRQLATLVNTQKLYKEQACRNLRSMPELDVEMQSLAGELFCGPGE
jgi:hypothetical protein